MSAKILYVEDDEVLSYLTKDNLQLKGYTVVHALTGNDALKKFSEYKFDLCILDIMLPQLDGYSVAHTIRQKNKDIPILFLSAKSQVADRLKGLRLGGDDYLTKPFSMEELILKIEVFLKRSRVNLAAEIKQITVGKSQFDFNNLQLLVNNQEYKLTLREGELLRYLIHNKNKVLKREDILSNIWGNDDYFLGRSLDVFISRLRKFLKSDKYLTIENIHGVGFRFNVTEGA